jgi:hypothetical protein
MNTTDYDNILPPEDEIQDEYDFSQGIRGKHYRNYRRGYLVKVHKTDGTIITHYFTLEEGAVILEPDVQAYFPDSETVNKALRGLIALIPSK